MSRLVAGRYVIDHERIVAPGHPNMKALAIYEVRDGTISRVWFLPDQKTGASPGAANRHWQPPPAGAITSCRG